MMEEESTREPVPVNEHELLRAATNALSSDFPNPERSGCPEASTLKAIAGRRLTFSEIDDLVDHIATCSPCFTAYSIYRKDHCFGRNVKRFAAGSVLAILIAASYLGFKALSPTVRAPVTVAEVAPLTAVLDFQNTTQERSVEASAPGPRNIPHLSRSLLNLQVRLPLGTEDGLYSLQFRDSSGAVEAETTGKAGWDGSAETLPARIDLRTIDPGPYKLAVRKGASSWRQYSLFID